MELQALMDQLRLVEDMCKHKIKPWIAKVGFDPELLAITPSWAYLDPHKDRLALRQMKYGERPVDYAMMFDGVKVLQINSNSNPLETIKHFTLSFANLAKQGAFITEDMKTVLEEGRKKQEADKEAILKLNMTADEKAYLYHKVKKLDKRRENA